MHTTPLLPIKKIYRSCITQLQTPSNIIVLSVMFRHITHCNIHAIGALASLQGAENTVPAVCLYVWVFEESTPQHGYDTCTR